MDDEYEFMLDGEYDIDKTVEQIREAWKCVPSYSLARLLDEIIRPGMYAEEVSEAFDEFITQNR